MKVLKDLEWEYGEVTRTKSPLHTYVIRYDTREKTYRVIYFSHLSGKSGSTYKKSVDEAIMWVEKVHYPSKMSKWVELDPKPSCKQLIRSCINKIRMLIFRTSRGS